MKTRIILCLTTLAFTACTKEEIPEIENSRVQFHVTIIHPESTKMMPAYNISGDVDGISFRQSGEGDDFITDAVEVESGRTVMFNFNAESSVHGIYHIEVLVNGRITASFGASCPSFSYQRSDEELPL